jgi:hypothetical protein
VQTICPDITVIHAAPLTAEFHTFISNMKQLCRCPLLAIVDSEDTRQASIAEGADIVVFEGLPSAKLADHITELTQSSSEG